MRICVVSQAFYPAMKYGGPIFSTLYLFKSLLKLYNIDAYVSTTNANMHSKLDVETNKWIKLENFYVKYYNETIIGKFSLSLFFNIWRDIKKADIIHIQAIFNTPIPISLFYAKLFRKPIILSPRGSLGEWPLKNGSRFKKLWLEMFIKPFANYVVWHATSNQEKNEILALFTNAKVEIIPNGIYIKEFQKFNKLAKLEFLQKYTGIIPKNINKIIISMGRLQKKKGFDILIDSFNEVLKKYLNSYLLIAGPDEGEKENLLKQIENLGLRKKVFLIGNIENQDKIDFLANADLFVLPSHNENFGNVYLESLSVGTPIVASKNTPWEEVEKYNCGKCVENSVKETSKAMLEILEKDRELMKKNSIKLANKYDLSEIAKEFKSLFERMINGKS